MLIKLLIFLPLALTTIFCNAQIDSTVESLKKLPTKYLTQIDSKIDRYSSRIISKTERTLEKLGKWESKIKKLLEKTSPETAQQLFGSHQTTFNTILQKIREGKSVSDQYRAKYNEYRDKLTTGIKYLEDQKENLDSKLITPIIATKRKLTELEEDISKVEAVEAFIRERKKQLINEAVKYVGGTKYLGKIDKESYYYLETMRNYKEIFSDRKKTEEVASKILNRIPAFKKFSEENSWLAQLFSSPSGNGSAVNLSGLQTRASINAMIQDRLAMGGPNARETFSQNMQQAQAELNQLKDKVLKAGGSSSEANIPDFKPNNQKSKTFFQRLEYGSNFQVAKPNSLSPITADIGLSVGYKLNDKSLAGIGASYKMGIGSIQRLSISHQGIGLRSFIDWKLKKQFFVSGGFEMNYNARFENLTQLSNYTQWQQAGLVGLTKKLNIKTKAFKGTSVQLLYDMLHRQHMPVSQPVLFRMGYSFK